MSCEVLEAREGKATGSFDWLNRCLCNRLEWWFEKECVGEFNLWDHLQILPTIAEDYVPLSSGSYLNRRMGEEAETGPVSKETSLFLKEALELSGFYSRHKGSFPTSRPLSPLVEAIFSCWWEEHFVESFEKSKGKDSADIFETFKVDEEVKKGSPLEVLKHFSGLREKDCDEYFSKEVKISFNFSFNFSEEVSMISLAKEDVVRSSVKEVSSLWGRMKGSNSTLRLEPQSWIHEGHLCLLNRHY